MTTHGEPVRVSVCHCLACQRRTGSTFGAQARFPSSKVTISGESKVYVRTPDSGNQIRFHFCPGCGATVYYQFGSDPDVIGVPVGAFADPGLPAPRVSVYESSRYLWASLPKDIEHIE
jgi:hypothetical protein